MDYGNIPEFDSNKEGSGNNPNNIYLPYGPDNPEPKQEKPLRTTILRESGANQDGDSGRFTQIEGSYFDANTEDDQQFKGEDVNTALAVNEEAEILMNGNSGVGKTSIIERFVNNTYVKDRDDEQPGMPKKVEEKKYFKVLKLDASTSIKLQLTDIGKNQNNSQQIPKQYYRDVHAVIIVFDITDSNSFYALEQWIKVAREQSPRNAIITIVGNKGDSAGSRQVSASDAHVVAQRNGIEYYEVSAKTGNNIDLLFEGLADKILVKIKENVGEDKVLRKKDRKSLGLKDANFGNEDDLVIKKKCC